MIELRTLGALELTSADSTAAGSVLAQPRRAVLLCYLVLATNDFGDYFQLMKTDGRWAS